MKTRIAIAALLAGTLLVPAVRSAAADSPEALAEALRPSDRPMLVHVWASWCAPCRAEWPRLAESLRRVAKLPADVVTIAVDGSTTEGNARALLRKQGDVPGRALVVVSPDAFAAVRAFDPDWDGSLPTTYVLRSGRVVLAQRGFTRLPQLERELAGGAQAPSADVSRAQNTGAAPPR